MATFNDDDRVKIINPNNDNFGTVGILDDAENDGQIWFVVDDDGETLPVALSEIAPAYGYRLPYYFVMCNDGWYLDCGSDGPVILQTTDWRAAKQFPTRAAAEKYISDYMPAGNYKSEVWADNQNPDNFNV